MPFPAALPGRRERQVDSTRARLFEAALAEFLRVGFVRANVARISFARLLARLDDLQLAEPSALSYAPSFITRGLNDLPLRFRRRS